MELIAYEELCKYKTCGWCGCLIGDQPIEMFQHPDGWEVSGLPDYQWLYITCPECKYEWSLWKLGVVEGRGK